MRWKKSGTSSLLILWALATPLFANPPAQVSHEAKESHVFFPNGGTQLDADATSQLNLLAQVLQTEVFSNACLKLVGHSDSSGGAAVNETIAMQRAKITAAYLKARMDAPERIVAVVSMGEKQLLETLPDESPWQRRVAFYARDCTLER